MKWSIKYEEPDDPKVRNKFREKLEWFITENSESIRRKSEDVLEVDGAFLCGSVVKFIVRLGGEVFFRREDLVSLVDGEFSFAGGKYDKI